MRYLWVVLLLMIGTASATEETHLFRRNTGGAGTDDPTSPMFDYALIYAYDWNNTGGCASVQFNRSYTMQNQVRYGVDLTILADSISWTDDTITSATLTIWFQSITSAYAGRRIDVYEGLKPVRKEGNNSTGSTGSTANDTLEPSGDYWALQTFSPRTGLAWDALCGGCGDSAGNMNTCDGDVTTCRSGGCIDFDSTCIDYIVDFVTNTEGWSFDVTPIFQEHWGVAASPDTLHLVLTTPPASASFNSLVRTCQYATVGYRPLLTIVSGTPSAPAAPTGNIQGNVEIKGNVELKGD